MATIPVELRDLLERPIYVQLATVRPDGSPQVNPMWFLYEDGKVKFTHTNARQKYRNVLANPRAAVCIQDPENTSRYLELRGPIAEITPDPTGEFFIKMANRYGRDRTEPPDDAPQRVILSMTIEQVATNRTTGSSATRPPGR